MYKQSVFPRWRGFNLLGMFCSETSRFYKTHSSTGYSEEDFKMIADWGFDFVRLPLSYRVWSSVDSPFVINEEKLAPLDEAVYFGKKYGLHVNIAMHRLPGYCVNDDEENEEKNNLWSDSEAQDAAVYQWRALAKRYKDINSENLSFNVINEPDWHITQRQYKDVNNKVITAVREISPERLFILDGTHFGDMPPVDSMRFFENCGYSCRGYEPRRITHYGVGDRDEYPMWPDMRKFDQKGDQAVRDREEMERFLGIWAALSDILKVGVHCGEMGVYYKCPHDVACRWLEDVMQILKSYNIGYALWNLRGRFGIMDSGRDDVPMKDFCGHKLDEKMLKILQKY